ncbi:TRAP-type C4-dicarboxylate transport system, small permease component [Thalassovita gelatinovora]|uniref:TRAP transporter small permease protein n=1 Tax=Thalassovita gelatinovora TaxID=53501 RepID=A0A0P1F5H8_THAGE|nr:TRAP transporter small permease subunit [Thalassovita gelatinovora]QIZ79589.1 TRAP transporter small permease [Thalassovita gelatinovora]CUH63086.1 TRAP-type C4-dicarboxylate transport system, small permease component [Thalassovita gelatinovora]SEQ15496.1 Tripartite ATP-independent transporter, DctQ component [Thalassovita gelatinovora]
MQRLERQFLLISRGAAMIGVLFLLMISGLSVVDIITREISGQPIRGAGDIAHLLTILIIAACFPAGLLERRQIKVTFLGAILPRAANRALEVFGALMTGLMFLAIAYYVTLHAQRVSASHEYTMVLNLPIAPWWWVATACFWVCVPAQLFVTVAEILGRPAPYHEA